MRRASSMFSGSLVPLVSGRRRRTEIPATREDRPRQTSGSGPHTFSSNKI